jgi:hypothetical protein
MRRSSFIVVGEEKPMTLSPPSLSLSDPLQDSEGSVDPLSLQRTYERLADKVLPAVTVRMGRIRFVTAMCFGALVCQKYNTDELGKDQVTPPWLVFEWFVIEAFARTLEDSRGEGIPGLLKVQSCLNNQRPVSAPAYLKTPKVFGFSGIFRRLATSSGILDEDLRLDDGGWELLKAWEREERLQGLIQGKGPGADIVNEMRDAVDRGLAAGHTVPRTGPFWSRIATHLVPSKIGKAEGRVLLDCLRSSSPRTREHLDHLVAHSAFVERSDEASYLRGVKEQCSADLASYLSAIDAYEALCRPIAETFDVLRELSTNRAAGPIGASDLAAAPSASRLVRELDEGCVRVERDPHLLDWEPDVRTLLDNFDRVKAPADLFDAIVGHHEQAQARKPPDGKRPWLERGHGSSVMVRTSYALPQRAEDTPAYVHDYRTRTLCRFLVDAGALT